ncbi:hypothetical protein K3495_g9567, partial [Podosphaera aphanis]
MNQLTILFDDPNRVRDAVARLHRNKQKNKAFSSWIAEIRRDAAIAGYENTQALTDIVFLNINLELQRALINEKDIDMLKFDEAVARLQDIDKRQRRFAESAANYRARKFLPQQISPNSSTQLTTTQGGDAMDLSASNVLPRGPLSQEKKKCRRKLGLWLTFGYKRLERVFMRIELPFYSDNDSDNPSKTCSSTSYLTAEDREEIMVDSNVTGVHSDNNILGSSSPNLLGLPLHEGQANVELIKLLGEMREKDRIQMLEIESLRTE